MMVLWTMIIEMQPGMSRSERQQRQLEIQERQREERLNNGKLRYNLKMKLSLKKRKRENENEFQDWPSPTSEMEGGKRSAWNWIKHKHKVTCCFYVFDSWGLPRYARIYLFFLDIILNLFMTLMFEDVHTNHLNRAQQASITVAVLLVSGVVFRLGLNVVYGYTNLLGKMISLLMLVFLTPLSFIGAMLYYIGIVGVIDAMECMIRFALTLTFAWLFEFIFLLIFYIIAKRYCTNCVALDDRDKMEVHMMHATRVLKHQNQENTRKKEEALRLKEERALTIRQELETKKREMGLHLQPASSTSHFNFSQHLDFSTSSHKKEQQTEFDELFEGKPEKTKKGEYVELL